MDEDVDEISILLADNGTPVTADRQLLAVVSSVLKGMPSSPTWDLSGLLVDGAPASRRMLLDWLNKAYDLVHGEPHDAAAAADAAAGAATAGARACELMLFADAAGSSKGLMAACGTAVEEVRQLRVQLPPHEQGGRPEELVLEMDGRAYLVECGRWAETSPDNRDEMEGPVRAVAVVMHVQPDRGGVREKALQQSVAAQLEQLLYIAGKYRLEPVLRRMRAFLAANTCLYRPFVFSDASLANMFSTRVQQAAAGTSLHDWGQQWTLQHMGGQRVRFNRTMVERPADDELLLLRPIDLSVEKRQPIRFTVRMPRDFLCWKRGEEVEAELCLFEDEDVTGPFVSGSTLLDEWAGIEYPCLILGGKPIALSMRLHGGRQ